MTAPRLLKKMLEVPVGEIVVIGTAIVEPRSQCTIARGFPSSKEAIAAAQKMNEVADWFGVLKTRAEGRHPNCQAELERIATSYGGRLACGATWTTRSVCADVVEAAENSTRLVK